MVRFISVDVVLILSLIDIALHCRDERKEQISASFAAKQKKRTDNIAMRNEKRKGGAAGAKGKGKARPGFEGKSFGKGGKGKAGGGGGKKK